MGLPFVTRKQVGGGSSGGDANATIIAPAWVAGESYIVGDVVTYKGKLYECISDFSSYNWDPTSWYETSVFESIIGILNEEM